MQDSSETARTSRLVELVTRCSVGPWRFFVRCQNLAALGNASNTCRSVQGQVELEIYWEGNVD